MNNMENTRIIYIILLCLIIGASLLYAYKCNQKFNKEHFTASDPKSVNAADTPLKLPLNPTNTQIEDYINKSILYAMRTIKPGNTGPKGTPGTQGIQGPPGGTFISQGVLRNLENPSMIMDRLSGTGIGAIAYLAEQNYKPQQTWTLNANNQLQNSYGQCLEADATGTHVFLNTCSGLYSGTDQKSITPGQQWRFDSSGRIVWNKSPNKPKCLSVKTIASLDNAVKIGSPNPVELRNIKSATLSDCEQTPTTAQQWSFY